MENLISSLKASDLPNEDVRYLADVIGLEAAQLLLERCAGMTFYIPLKMSKDFHRQYIAEHFTGTVRSARALAQELGITEQTVYRILRGKSARPAA